MKKFKFIAFLLFATMLSVNLTSCGDDDEPGDMPGPQGPDEPGITVEEVSSYMIKNMIKVEGGTFLMGSYGSESDSDERPIHSVTLDDYYIGKTEVTRVVKTDNRSTHLHCHIHHFANLQRHCF